LSIRPSTIFVQLVAETVHGLAHDGVPVVELDLLAAGDFLGSLFQPAGIGHQLFQGQKTVKVDEDVEKLADRLERGLEAPDMD